MPVINRVTLFKIPREEDQAVVLEQFKKLQHGALKNGKAYIKSVKAGRIMDASRSQGFTVVLQTVFSNLQDLQFFDSECAFHMELKKVVGPRMKPPPVVAYFNNVVVEE